MHVAVGIIHNAYGEILIAQRMQGKYKPGLWEFPGGKIENDESIFQALQRELQEELAIRVIAAEPWLQIQHDYSDRIVLLEVWQVTKFTGTALGAEGQPIRWVSHQQLSQYEFPAGNQAILQKLTGKNLG